MSAHVSAGYELASAQAYNEGAGKRWGLPGAMPPNAVLVYPGLSWPADTLEFAEATLKFQHKSGFGGWDCDGKMGPKTWTQLVKAFDHVSDFANYIVVDGRRHSLLYTGTTYVAFDQPGAFDLHRAGKFTSRAKGRRVQFVVVHWGGINPRHLYDYFRGTDKKVSSHWAIGPDKACQMLDLAHKAWHCGWANLNSVGIDIAQHCLQTDSIKHYKGHPIEVIQDPTMPGREVLSLHPGTAAATRHVIESVLEVYGLELRWAEPGRVYSQTEVEKAGAPTVYGHHHLSKNKTDVGPWWQNLLDAA